MLQTGLLTSILQGIDYYVNKTDKAGNIWRKALI